MGEILAIHNFNYYIYSCLSSKCGLNGLFLGGLLIEAIASKKVIEVFSESLHSEDLIESCKGDKSKELSFN